MTWTRDVCAHSVHSSELLRSPGRTAAWPSYVSRETCPIAFALCMLGFPSGDPNFLSKRPSYPKLHFVQDFSALALLAFGAG